MTALVIRADARQLPLPDASVDLIVTSPPYFGLRSYTDGGEHYAGQIGSEETPGEWLQAMLDCTREWMRVLKPTGSLWVNLGDKYASAGGAARQGSSGQMAGRGIVHARAEAKRRGIGEKAHREDGGLHRSGDWGIPNKSLIGTPWRYALACIDELGLILRAELIWSKPNALPESVTDRVRRAHEQWFHFTVQPRYFAAVDVIREPHTGGTHARRADGQLSPKEASTVAAGHRRGYFPEHRFNALGKLPASVWEIPSEPLTVPDDLEAEHFAAFPTEWPRRLILGWSPGGICTACGEGRCPIVDRDRVADRPGRVQGRAVDALLGGHGADGRAGSRFSAVASVVGEACGCLEPTAPTTPSVILDPFGGTGTTSLVAHALGRVGISVDRSADYCRIARWRITDPAQLAKAMRVEKPPTQTAGQLQLFA